MPCKGIGTPKAAIIVDFPRVESCPGPGSTERPKPMRTRFRDFLLSRQRRGVFHFIHDLENEERAFLDWISSIFHQPYTLVRPDTGEEPLLGYPVLEDGGSIELINNLFENLRSDLDHHISSLSGRGETRRKMTESKRKLSRAISDILENCAAGSFPRFHSAVFWLYLSSYVTSAIVQVPQKVAQKGVKVGSESGEELKYRVFNSFSNQLTDLIDEMSSLLQKSLGRTETAEILKLLIIMKENRLIFTEEYIKGDYLKLSSYFRGCIHRDLKKFQGFVSSIESLLVKMARRSRMFRKGLELIVKSDSSRVKPSLIVHIPGVIDLLEQSNEFDRIEADYPGMAAFFRELSGRLKKYEIMNFIRGYIVKVRREGEGYITLRGNKIVPLLPDVRPFSFFMPGIVETRINRCGLVYDIVDFTGTIETLKRQGPGEEKKALKHMRFFQESLAEIERETRINFEKYLGDGAFYSSRNARDIVEASIKIQRLYGKLKSKGFIFKRGIRVSVNYSYYDLLPIRSDGSEGGTILEFHGPGLIELTRLIWGKAGKEIEEFKEFLINHGYSSTDVYKFFAPLEKEVKEELNREDFEFKAYIDKNGYLVNEGVVASEDFVMKLGNDLGGEKLYAVKRKERFLVAFHSSDGSLFVGLDCLGVANLKGMGATTVYEVVDLAEYKEGEKTLLEVGHLKEAFQKTLSMSKSE